LRAHRSGFMLEVYANMKLIIGLGNPGKKYEWTRHNLAWLVLDKIAGEEKWEEHHKAKALTLKVGQNMLVKPLTFMNESGRAVRSLMDFYKLSPADIFVVHDDKDMEFGQMRAVKDSGSGGHNGVQSIINYLATQEFTRLKLGIANKKIGRTPTDAFVLQPFSFFEKRTVKKWLPEIVKKIEESL